MATAIRRRKWPSIALAAVVLVIAAGVLYREPIAGYAHAGAAYGARTACACRYVTGRALGDCKKDFEPGMWPVFVSDAADEKRTTAYVPLLASETARYRTGYGCLLDPWKD